MQKMGSRHTGGGITFSTISSCHCDQHGTGHLDTPNSPISSYLKLVQEAANRGKELIKQIITFSRPEEQVALLR
jgi:hypothetical protein